MGTGRLLEQPNGNAGAGISSDIPSRFMLWKPRYAPA